MTGIPSIVAGLFILALEPDRSGFGLRLGSPVRWRSRS